MFFTEQWFLKSKSACGDKRTKNSFPVFVQHMISLAIVEEIERDVKRNLPSIFGDNFVFGFICGGFAKGYADVTHDIDIFVCVKENDETAYDKYLAWYLDLHRRHGFPPDLDYPGEVVTLNRLRSILELQRYHKISSLIVEDIWIKKSIIWADMFAGQIMGATGSVEGLDILESLRVKCVPYPARWKQDVLALLSEDLRKQWEDKHQLLLMERFMSYPKHDRGSHRIIR